MSTEVAMQVAIHAFNLDSRCQADESLQELSETDYPLELLHKENIKELARKYLGSSKLGGLARVVVKKVEWMEMKEKVRKEREMSRKRSADSISPGSSSGVSPSSSSGSPPLNEQMITSKRTMPTKFVPKSKQPVPLMSLKVAPPSKTNPPPRHAKKTDADERLQKFLEKKRLEKENNEAVGRKDVSSVKRMLEEARKKNREEAKKAKETGSWGDEGAPSAKKARFIWKR